MPDDDTPQESVEGGACGTVGVEQLADLWCESTRDIGRHSRLGPRERVREHLLYQGCGAAEAHMSDEDMDAAIAAATSLAAVREGAAPSLQVVADVLVAGLQTRR